MDFFAHQEAARKKSGVLLWYYFLAVASIIAAVYLVIIGVFSYNAPTVSLWYPQLFAYTSVFVLLIIGSGTLYKVSVLKTGGDRIAEMLGGTFVQPDTTDLHERRLLNVVEEMAIASGVPVPSVYVMDKEKGINAFAAGFSTEDAVIGVTRGAMELLTRDELQGVIGHEYSHIFNGDMRLNIKLIGLLHGILIIAIIGRVILNGMSRGRRSNSSKNSGGAAFIILALALIVIGYLGVFFGNLIKGAVSRQREYLADASAVQFTRNSQGLADALKKIGAMQFGSQLQSSRAEEASHLFFSNALGTAFFNLLATHPPLAARIRILDPHFAGEFPELSYAEAGKAALAQLSGEQPVSSLNGGVVPGPAAIADLSADPDKVIAAIGVPLRDHFEKAGQLIAGLPEEIRGAARDPFGARALIYCLLLDRNEEVRNIQLNQLREHADPAVYADTLSLMAFLDLLSPAVRLPLVDLALPALRQLSPDQYSVFKTNMDLLMRADKKINVFEYMLRTIVSRHLETEGSAQQREASINRLTQASAEISIILSLLAIAGHNGSREASKAFAHATRMFAKGLQAKFAFLPDGQLELKDMDQALNRLNAARPDIKKSVMTACLACLVYDRKVTIQEAELFRAIGAVLDCPVPLMMASSI